MNQHTKPKTAIKTVVPNSPRLRREIRRTLAMIADIVGGTLGPGGHPVLIERQEDGVAPMITKDGVTVFKALGCESAVQQIVLEATRDASIRTANEAGDGTTTATILTDALEMYTARYCAERPEIPSQVVVREIQRTFDTILEPAIAAASLKCDLESESGRARLRAVASISANGDSDLADAVMRCFDICGDDGNIQIVESSGRWGYEVEQIKGYPVPMGYEESCQKYAPGFINDPGTQRCVLTKPAFVLYFGRISDIQSVVPLMGQLQEMWNTKALDTPNVVLMATGFSETVLATLMNNFLTPDAINIMPVAIPMSPIPNGQRHILDDLAAVTGGKVLDQLTAPLPAATVEAVGNIEPSGDVTDTGLEIWKSRGVESVEIGRYRTTIVGRCDDELLLQRIDEVKAMVDHAESTLDATLLRERLAKLSGGIAKLRVVGSANGEMKERRDRAEDAVCAVRGAIKSGCLPGGGWMLARMIHLLPENEINDYILAPSLEAPIKRLYQNGGLSDQQVMGRMMETSDESGPEVDPANAEVFNVATASWVRAVDGGVLDSTPAVRDALRNAIAAATVLGTCGGIIAFTRDTEIDRLEARSQHDYAAMVREGSQPEDE